MPSSLRTFGNTAEEHVAHYLQERGFCIVKRNYTTRVGEIDIIAVKDDLLLFIEVKARKHTYFHSSLLITKTKQKRIIKTAQIFLVSEKIYNKVCRFDVALVIKKAGTFELEYIENAFQAGSDYS